ncbi:MAG: RNA methyltransferase [Malacoplasma sp.]|nr:RNA methyltransferase [Malacoplasma sp.]
MQEIISKDNKIVKKVKKLFVDKKYRESTNLFVCESYRVIEAFINNNFKLDLIFVTNNSKYFDKVKKNEKTILIDQKIYNSLSELKTGDGLIAVFNIPKKQEQNIDDKIIILDQIQNPNNMGAVLRSAAAFNMKQIILANSCVDIYNPKVIQSSMGYGYDIPIKFVTDLRQTIRSLQSKGIKVYATAVDSNAVKLNQIKLGKCAVVLGNEGNGIKKDIVSICDQSIFIPMNKKVDSLNISIAASIIMCKLNNENS